MIQPNDRDILEAYLDSGLDDEELITLEFRICTEEDFARHLIEVSCEEIVIREWAELQRSRSWCSSLAKWPPGPKSRILSKWYLFAGTLFLAITLSITFIMIHLAAPPVVSPAENVAVVHMLSGGELKMDGVLYVVSDYLQPSRQYHLDHGVAQLQMGSGVSVLVSGPSTFQLPNPKSFNLLQGAVVANVPKAAIGFEVRTPSLKVVDLGTRFGVHVDEAGVTETRVFQGSVNCFSLKSGSTQGSPQRVTEGQAVKRSANGAITQSETESELLFGTCLMQEFGIRHLTGTLKYLSTMPSSVEPCEFTSNEHIYVFLERQSFSLPTDLNCNIPDQNRSEVLSESEPQGQFEPGVIKQGTKVDVYYIHHDIHCPGEPGYSEQRQAFFMKGGIRFKNRILGILPTDPLLLQTDQALGKPGVSYGTLEIRSAEDEIRILPDNSTLHLDWNVGVTKLNVVRVIVAADDK